MERKKVRQYEKEIERKKHNCVRHILIVFKGKRKGKV